MAKQTGPKQIGTLQAVLIETIKILRLHFEMDHPAATPAIERLDQLVDIVFNSVDQKVIEATIPTENVSPGETIEPRSANGTLTERELIHGYGK